MHCRLGHTLASAGLAAAIKWVWLPHCTLKTQPFLLRLSKASSVLSTCLQSSKWLGRERAYNRGCMPVVLGFFHSLAGLVLS